MILITSSFTWLSWSLNNSNKSRLQVQNFTHSTYQNKHTRKPKYLERTDVETWLDPAAGPCLARPKSDSFAVKSSSRRTLDVLKSRNISYIETKRYDASVSYLQISKPPGTMDTGKQNKNYSCYISSQHKFWCLIIGTRLGYNY